MIFSLVCTLVEQTEEVVTIQKLVASEEEDGWCGGDSEKEVITDEWVCDVL